LEKVTDFCEPQHTNKSFAHTYYIYLQTFLNIDIKQVLFSPGDLMSLNLNQQFFFTMRPFSNFPSFQAPSNIK